MKNKNLLVAAFCVFGALNLTQAQNVGINTTGAAGDGSAMLDVEATDKGVLIPRVALTARNNNAPIGAGIATSLLVYNTATAGTGTNAVSPGYYYWNGTIWMRVATDGDYWRVDGNLGTTASTAPVDMLTTDNFIGTRDAQDFVFSTNGFERMRLKSDNNQTIRVGIGTTFAPSFPVGAGNTPTLLHVFDGGMNASDFAQLQLGSAKNSATNKVGELNFHSSVNTSDRRTAGIESFITAVTSGPNVSGDLRFFTNNGTVALYSEKMRIQPNGRVGIGTTDPQQGLHLAFPNGANAAVRVQNTGATGNAWDIQSTNAGHLHFNQMSAATPFNALHLNGANGYVGINSGTPSERLTVIGNFSLNGAFMPNDIPGNADQILMSAGPGNSPVWGPGFLNVSQIQGIGKFFIPPFNIAANTELTLTLSDPDAVVTSTLTHTLIGPLPAIAGFSWSDDLSINVEARNGEFIFHIVNRNPTIGITNLQISYVAHY